MCKEMPVIPVNMKLDKKRMIGKIEGQGGGEAQGVADQGCQIFLGTRHQNGENVPNCHKICKMAIKYFQWPQQRPNAQIIYQEFFYCKTH
jgi:hypothetical protein